MDSKNNVASSCLMNKIENIKRCNQCNKIPLLEFILKNNQLFIKYNCENDHNEEMSLEDFLKNNKNFVCEICKTKTDFLNFDYCISCKQVLCNNCVINHRTQSHQTIFLSKYDSTCLIHNQLFYRYCLNCQKNFCYLCSNHKLHETLKAPYPFLTVNQNNIFQFKMVSEEIIEGLKKEIEELKNQLQKIEFIYSKYQKNMNLLCSLFNNLLDTYEIEKQLNNKNYHVSTNLQNIEKIKFPFDEIFPSFSNCNNIFEKSKKYLSYCEKKIIEKNDVYDSLSYHKDSVNQIILLKDGRIASSSNDKSIIIYNKEDLSIQLQINFEDINKFKKENDDNCVLNIMQGSNDYIFVSLYSGKIVIIKLTSLTSYTIIQNFNAHNDILRKIIELKDGRYASCSADKTIKIWKFINNELILDTTISTDKVSSIEEGENEIISTPILENGSIIFWNINTLEKIAQINGIACVFCWNILKKISNNTFIVGGARNIYLIKNHKLINSIQLGYQFEIYSVCYLNNQNILTGHFNRFISIWNFNDDKLVFLGQKKVHDDRVRVISQINDDLILSGSCDTKIKRLKLRPDFYI